MTDRERWGLRGPVRSCSLERRWYSRRCGADASDTVEHGDATALEFREDGGIVRQAQHNPDGSRWICTRQYDGAGLLTEMLSENDAGAISRRLHEYDDAGRLVRVLDRDGHRTRMRETYEYEASGNRIKTVHMDLDSPHAGALYASGVEGTDSLYTAQGVSSVVTTHNERKQPVRLLFRDQEGSELSRVVFLYNDAGQLMEEVQTNSELVLPLEVRSSVEPGELAALKEFFGAGENPIRRTHVYDELGCRIATISNTPFGFDRRSATYNEQGDPVVEVNEHEDREYAIGEGGQLADGPSRLNRSRAETRFRYEYDALGNWVSKTVEGRPGGEGEFVVSGVERRAITYFN